MAKNEFQVEGNRPRAGLEPVTHRLEGGAPGQSWSAPCQAVAGTTGRKIAKQRVAARIGNRQAIDVQHRVTEPRPHQGIANVVHIEEAMDVLEAVDLAPGFAEPGQRIGTESRKSKQAVLAQYARQFLRESRGFIDPRQQQVGEHDVDALVGKRQPPRIGLHHASFREPATPGAVALQHVGGKIDADDLGALEALRELTGRSAGPATKIDDKRGVDCYGFESREQTLTRYRVHKVGIIETRCSLVKASPNVTRVDGIRLVHGEDVITLSSRNTRIRDGRQQRPVAE